jgi:two-component system, NarL family, sensor kinase
MIESYSNLVIIGIIGMLTLSIGIIFFVVYYQRKSFQHQQQLRQNTLETQEQTMSQLASELHDDVGVLLSSVKLFLSKSGAEHPDLMKQSQELLNESIEKIRNLSHQLHPATLQHLGLAVAVQSLLEVIHKSANIETSFQIEGTVPTLSEHLELSLYRMVQELLNNLMKHAHPATIVLQLACCSAQVNIQITHNGNGITNEQYQAQLYQKAGIGLKNVYNRLQLLDAQINFEEKGKQLFSITIDAPIK